MSYDVAAKKTSPAGPLAAPTPSRLPTTVAVEPAVEQGPIDESWQPKGAVAGTAATDAKQRLDALNAQLTAARTTGTVGTAVANTLTGGAYGSAARVRDQAVEGVNALYERLVKRDGGRLSDRSALVLNAAIDSASEGIANLREVRAGVVSTTADLGTNAALVAAAPFTGGASLAGVATLATVGAGTRVALNGTMQGSGYSAGEAVGDAALGGAQGALAGAVRVGALAARVPGPLSREALSDARFLTRTGSSLTREELGTLHRTYAAIKERVAAGVGTVEEKTIGRRLGQILADVERGTYPVAG